MPRINFEETVWADIRFAVLFAELIKRFPDLETTIVRQLAAGALLSAWRVAQQYYTDKADPGSPIPSAIWIKSGLCDQLITADFAEPVEGGIRMKGSEEAFEWILERREAGSKGGNAAKESRTIKKSNNQVQQTIANDSKPQQTIASYSYSYSSSSSSRDQIQKKKEKEEVPPAVAVARRPKKQKPDEPSPTYEVWMAFADQYQEAWNVRPPSNAKNFRKCKELVDAVGLEDAKKIAVHYAKSCNEWYVKNGHDLVWMVKDYMRLHKEVNIGIKFTREVVKDLAAKENFDNHEVYGKHKMNICDDEQFEAYCQELMEKEQNDVSKIDQGSSRKLAENCM